MLNPQGKDKPAHSSKIPLWCSAKVKHTRQLGEQYLKYHFWLW